MKWWRQYSKRFLTLQIRERKLIFYATQVVIIWLAAVLFIEPLLQQTSQLNQQNVDTEQQIQRLQQQTAIIQRALNVDLNEQVQAQIGAQQQVEQELTQKIQQMTGSYISANQMLTLLEDLLVKMPEVQLAALENFPAKPVLIGTDAKAAPLLFQHRTKLVFLGNYASLQQLLSQLQQLSWQLHWVKLNYKVIKYPEAQLQLELETVSESANYVQI
jgi:MSHA biogenesis protein MshJ